MINILCNIYFLSIPVAAITSFVVCLVRFLSAKRRLKKGEFFSPAVLRGRKIAMFATAVAMVNIVIGMAAILLFCYWFFTMLSM